VKARRVGEEDRADDVVSVAARTSSLERERELYALRKTERSMPVKTRASLAVTRRASEVSSCTFSRRRPRLVRALQTRESGLTALEVLVVALDLGLRPAVGRRGSTTVLLDRPALRLGRGRLLRQDLLDRVRSARAGAGVELVHLAGGRGRGDGRVGVFAHRGGCGTASGRDGRERGGGQGRGRPGRG